MSFFSVVKVRRDGVLEQVNEQVAEQHQQGAAFAPGEFQAFRYHFDECGGQHEARAQRHKVAEVTPLPALLHDDRAAENVGCGSGQPQQDTGEDGRHGRKKDNRAAVSDQHARLLISYPLCLMCMTSPSFTMYSLPSTRSVPRARPSASEPAASSWSQ